MALCSKCKHKKMLCKQTLINKLLPLLPSSSRVHLQQIAWRADTAAAEEMSHSLQRGQMLK